MVLLLIPPRVAAEILIPDHYQRRVSVAVSYEILQFDWLLLLFNDTFT